MSVYREPDQGDYAAIVDTYEINGGKDFDDKTTYVIVKIGGYEFKSKYANSKKAKF